MQLSGELALIPERALRVVIITLQLFYKPQVFYLNFGSELSLWLFDDSHQIGARGIERLSCCQI